MMTGPTEVHCDLLVIGTGVTGMAAALFAANRRLETVLVGSAGELRFASGLLDLMGVHPVDQGRVWDNPWQAIGQLVRDCPRHPYAMLDTEDMRLAMSEFLTFLSEGSLPYVSNPNRNLRLLTPVGTLKTTFAVPEAAYAGAAALSERAPCLIVGFQGLKGFSSRQIVETLGPAWPSLTACCIPFPDAGPGDLFAERMAMHLELSENRAKLADAIGPHLGDATYVGLPAVLGLYRPAEVFDDMQLRLGRRVFEIPTMPPCIGGLRVKHLFEQKLPEKGVRIFSQQKVLAVSQAVTGGFRCNVGGSDPETVVHAKGVVLATGRFFGGGLRADRRLIRETLLGLPVYQPPDRSGWHRERLFDPRGHGINSAGIETDARLRPLGADGKASFAGLFAAGSILAHQDWMRMKCGSGLAITTAYGAVKAFAEIISVR